MYLLLSDIFRGQAPVNYGSNTQVNLDTMAWRREMINAYVKHVCRQGPSRQQPPPDNLDILCKKKHDIVVMGKAGLEVPYDEVSRA